VGSPVSKTALPPFTSATGVTLGQPASSASRQSQDPRHQALKMTQADRIKGRGEKNLKKVGLSDLSRTPFGWMGLSTFGRRTTRLGINATKRAAAARL
jgi:hypothetical protein